MEFRILGPLVVLDDGEELALGPAKERAVLAALLLRAGSVVSRTQLVEDLWGESPPSTAARAVNVYVSQLRKTLARNGGAAIETRAPGYALAVDPESVDAVRFQRLAAAARERAASGELEAAATLMREALALWRGPALMGIDLEGAGGDDVARLGELRLAAELEWIDYGLALGRHEQLVAELERLVARYPLDERLRGQLVLALYRCGRQAGALQAYRNARETLVEELGLEPSPSLQRLEKAVLNQDPSLAEPAGTGHAAPARRARRSAGRLAYAAGAVTVAAVTALVAVRGFDDARSSTLVANSLARLDASGRVEDVTRVGTLPRRVVALDDAVWLISARKGTLSRVVARSGIVTTLALPGFPRDIAGGEGAVWAATAVNGGTVVARIDPLRAEVESTRRVAGVSPMALAAGHGAVWLAGQNLRGSGGVLVRLSLATNTVVESIPLPSKPSGIEVGPQTVWITAQLPASPTLRSSLGAVYVVDPSSSRIVARSRASFVPLQGRTSFAVNSDAAWIAGAEGAVLRLNPRTAALTRVVRTPLATDAVTVSAGSVWAAADGGVIYRLEPRTGAVLDRIGHSRPGLRPTGILATSGHLWLTLGPPQTLRTSPLLAKGQRRAVAIPVRDGPGRIRYGAGALWVRSPSGGLLRIDPQRNRVVAKLRTGGGGDIAFADGSVWATSFNNNAVDRIDPKTNALIARIPTNSAAPLGIAVADGAVWVANHHADPIGGDRTGSVVRIDPQRNRVVAKIPLGAQEYCCGPDNMVAAFGDIWVDIPNQNLVVRIDARRTRVAARIPVPDGCGQLTVGAGSVWLAAGCSPGLLRIDPETNEIVARIDTLGSPAYPIGYFDGSVWTTTDDLRLLRVDPSSNSVVATTDVAPSDRPEGGGPMFAFGDGSIWISDYEGGRVLRVAVPAG